MNQADEARITVRLPYGLPRRIKAAAEKSGRSMNGEIVRALEDAFPSVTFDDVIADILHSLEVAERIYGQSAQEAYANQALSLLAAGVYQTTEGRVADDIRDKLRALIARLDFGDDLDAQ